MKHIRKFNEELNPQTYLSAADKLEFSHPKRAKELKDYGMKQADKDKKWNLISISPFEPYNGELLDCYIRVIGRRVCVPIGKDTTAGINIIYANENGMYSTRSDVYCKNRADALEMSRELKKFGIDVPVNKLYTEREYTQYINHEEKPKKKRWWQKD